MQLRTRLGHAALIAGLSALSLAGCAATSTGAKVEATASRAAASASPNSPAIRALAVSRTTPTADADIMALLKAGDIDAVLRFYRAEPDDAPPQGALAVLFDDLAAGKAADARAIFEALPNRQLAGDLAEAWLLLAEGKPDEAARRAQRASSLSEQLAGAQAALIREAAGDLNAARALYLRLERSLDATPPPETEPRSLEEALRSLQAPQTAQILYRSALIAHRVGETEDAARLYELVSGFAERAPDLVANRARLAEGRPPVEPALDQLSGLGRWSLYLAEEFTRADALAKALTDPTPSNDLVSLSGAIFSQTGVAYDPSAEDWILSIGHQMFAVNEFTTAGRFLDRIGQRSVFRAEADLVRAQMALRRNEDPAAVRYAQAALRAAPARYDIAMTAAQTFSQAGRERETLAAYDAAKRLAIKPEDIATALVARGYANLFFGRIDAAIEDARAALTADRANEGVRIAAVAIFKDRADTWQEGVALGRELLREHPDSVSRLNQLGYTLIHREEGLEEGFVLLHRGASLGENDYAVIDSLGWAHYLHGDFEEALRLIKRADQLTGNDPNAEILDHLGDVHWRLNQQAEAKAAWRRALAARPEVQRRRELEAKLRDGLTVPAPVKRPLPPVEEVKPRERQQT